MEWTTVAWRALILFGRKNDHCCAALILFNLVA